MKRLLILAALVVLLPFISDAAEVREQFLKDDTHVVPNPTVETKNGEIQK
jgi:hypothetical protein